MSLFTSLRDAVLKPIAVVASAATGLPLTNALPVSAGGVSTSQPSQASAAPSGAVAQGGVPNQNPNIFGSLSTMSNQTILLIFGGMLLLVLLFKRA